MHYLPVAILFASVAICCNPSPSETETKADLPCETIHEGDLGVNVHAPNRMDGHLALVMTVSMPPDSVLCKTDGICMVHATNTEYDPDLDNVRFIMYLPGGMPNPEGAQMIAYAGVTTELTVYSPLDFEQNFCDDLSCDADITCCYGPTPVGTISSGIQTGTFKVVGDGNFSCTAL